VIGEAVAAAARGLGESVLAKIGGPIGEAARAAAAELRGLDATSARKRRAEWCAAARAPVVAGLRRIHPSWIEHALAGSPERTRRGLAEGPRDRVDVWLARRACAHLAPMIARDREVAELLARPPEVLVAWLVRLGEGAGDDLECVRAGVVAIAPRLAPYPLAARQLAQRLPRPLGIVVLRSLRTSDDDR
jgi:hypothetical protein